MAVVHDERVLLLYGHPLGDETRDVRGRFGGGYAAVISGKGEWRERGYVEARRSDGDMKERRWFESAIEVEVVLMAEGEVG